MSDAAVHEICETIFWSVALILLLWPFSKKGKE